MHVYLSDSLTLALDVLNSQIYNTYVLLNVRSSVKLYIEKLKSHKFIRINVAFPVFLNVYAIQINYMMLNSV